MVSFISQGEVRVKKKGKNKHKLAKTLTTKIWYMGRVHKMRCKIDIGGLSIDNQLTYWTGLPIWN